MHMREDGLSTKVFPGLGSRLQHAGPSSESWSVMWPLFLILTSVKPE